MLDGQVPVFAFGQLGIWPDRQLADKFSVLVNNPGTTHDTLRIAHHRCRQHGGIGDILEQDAPGAMFFVHNKNQIVFLDQLRVSLLGEEEVEVILEGPVMQMRKLSVAIISLVPLREPFRKDHGLPLTLHIVVEEEIRFRVGRFFGIGPRIYKRICAG